MNNNLTEEEYVDTDYEEIAIDDNETDLITKLNSPINIFLIILIVIVIVLIVLALAFL